MTNKFKVGLRNTFTVPSPTKEECDLYCKEDEDGCEVDAGQSDVGEYLAVFRG